MAALDDAVRLSADARVWRIDRASSTLIRVWGQEAVVYDSRSSSTHLLTPAALAVYDALRELGQADPARILAHLDDGAEDSAPTEEELLALRDILDSLQQVGLAESRGL